MSAGRWGSIFLAEKQTLFGYIFCPHKGVPREPHLVERGSRPGLNAALAWSAGALIINLKFARGTPWPQGLNIYFKVSL